MTRRIISRTIGVNAIRRYEKEIRKEFLRDSKKLAKRLSKLCKDGYDAKSRRYLSGFKPKEGIESLIMDKMFKQIDRKFVENTRDFFKNLKDEQKVDFLLTSDGWETDFADLYVFEEFCKMTYLSEQYKSAKMAEDTLES